MSSLSTDSLEQDLAAKVTQFFQEILDKYPANIHSLYLVGSVLTLDFIEKISDINSIIVLQEMDLAFLDVLAPLGKTYRQQGFAAPLIMDPPYIAGSLDVFPIEFLSFKLIHHTLWGEDLLAGLEIGAGDVKRQAERELKGKLMWLRRGYVSAAGDAQFMAANIVRQFTGYVPLLRALIFLRGQTPPVAVSEVMARLSELVGAEAQVFSEIYSVKRKASQPSKEELTGLFARFYRTTERLGEIVDGLKTL